MLVSEVPICGRLQTAVGWYLSRILTLIYFILFFIDNKGEVSFYLHSPIMDLKNSLSIKMEFRCKFCKIGVDRQSSDSSCVCAAYLSLQFEKTLYLSCSPVVTDYKILFYHDEIEFGWSDSEKTSQNQLVCILVLFTDFWRFAEEMVKNPTIFSHTFDRFEHKHINCFRGGWVSFSKC